MTEKWKHNSKTARKKSPQGHKGSQVAKKGQTGKKGQKGPFGPYYWWKNIEITVFDWNSANECLKNNSTTQKHPGRSHQRGTRSHKWPERAKKCQKGPTGPFWTILLVKNSEITVFDSKSANECLKNNNTTRKHPGRRHQKGTKDQKWPERATKGQKGPKGRRWPCWRQIVDQKGLLNGFRLNSS